MHGMLIGCAIFEYRILCFLLVGASEQDMAKWWDPLALPWCSTNSLFIKLKPVTTLYLMLWQIRIWRVAFLSNFAATSINLFYAATEQVSFRSRLYCLHLKILVSYFSSFWKNLLSNKPPDGGSVCASSCQYDRQFHLVDFVFRDTLER